MDSSSHENCLSFHLSKMIATQDTHPLHFPISHAQCLAIRVPSLIISPTAFTVAAVTQTSQSHCSPGLITPPIFTPSYGSKAPALISLHKSHRFLLLAMSPAALQRVLIHSLIINLILPTTLMVSSQPGVDHAANFYSLIRQQGTSTHIPTQVPSVPPPSNVASSPAESLYTQPDRQPYPSYHAHGDSSNSDLPQQFSYHPSSGIFVGGSTGAPPNHDDPSVHASLQPGYSLPPDASGYGASAHASAQFGYSSSLSSFCIIFCRQWC